MIGKIWKNDDEPMNHGFFSGDVQPIPGDSRSNTDPIGSPWPGTAHLGNEFLGSAACHDFWNLEASSNGATPNPASHG